MNRVEVTSEDFRELSFLKGLVQGKQIDLRIKNSQDQDEEMRKLKQNSLENDLYLIYLAHKQMMDKKLEEQANEAMDGLKQIREILKSD